MNYTRGIEKAVDYLYDIGHRRMAFISHHSTLGPISVRERAFRSAVERHSSRVKWTIVANVDGLDGGRQAARDLLESGFQPTAIVCVNDFMALGVFVSCVRENCVSRRIYRSPGSTTSNCRNTAGRHLRRCISRETRLAGLCSRVWCRMSRNSGRMGGKRSSIPNSCCATLQARRKNLSVACA